MTRVFEYRYLTESWFCPEAREHFFKLRAVPCENSFQHIIRNRVDIMPRCIWRESLDGFGNPLQYGSIDSSHEVFRVISSGVVECGTYSIPDSNPSYMYMSATPLTTWSRRMEGWCRWHLSHNGNPQSTSEKASIIMHAVHNLIRYRKGATSNSTTAMQVFELRKGVCQDYAHLMIAALRSIGIYARYVNGLIKGEGETHAWVEVHTGRCWKAYDPTFDRIAKSDYLKIAHGRDVGDCPSNRGRLFSWTEERMRVTVEVWEIKKEQPTKS